MRTSLYIFFLFLILSSRLFANGNQESGGNSHRNKAISIGLIINSQNIEISAKIQQYIGDISLAYKKTTITHIDIYREDISPLQAIKKLTDLHVSAILIYEQNSQLHESFLNGLNENKSTTPIPLVFFHYAPSDNLIASYPKIAVVSPDNRSIGAMQAQYIIKQLSEKSIEQGNIGMLTGSISDTNQEQISEGFFSYMEEFGNMFTISQTRSADWKKLQAISVVESWLTTDSLISIVANNNAMILGASIPLREQEIEGLVLVGAGSDQETLDAIKKGYVSATVYIDTEKEFTQAVNTARNMVFGSAYQKIQYSDILLISKENVNLYIQ